MGVAGVSFRDFHYLLPEELDAIFEAHRESLTNDIRERWEMMRLHAVLTMQPHCKNRLDPKKVLPFPWEKSQPQKTTTPVQSKEKAREAFLDALRRTTP